MNYPVAAKPAGGAGAGGIGGWVGPCYGAGSSGDPLVPDDVASAEPMRHQLSPRKKVYEFFSAPVTRFYLHLVSCFW